MFLFISIILLVALVIAFPQVLPKSIMDRLGHTFKGSDPGTTEPKVDKSACTRLILWAAAGEMIKESPILGKGFKMFQVLAHDYAAEPIHESDTHNMFFWIATQLGLPALIVFLLIFWRGFWLAFHIGRNHKDDFGRVIGVGIGASIVGMLFICMFGSRMTSSVVNAYIWVYLAILAHIANDMPKYKIK
jgi:O-antigen ligase